MHPKLEVINNISRQLEIIDEQLLIYKDKWDMESLISAQPKLGEWKNLRKEFDREFSIVLRELTPTQILEGYQQSSDLLRRRLGASMYANFDEIYISTMIHATNNGYKGSHLFLKNLGDNLTKIDFANIVEKAMKTDNVELIETAIAAAMLEGFTQFIDDIETLEKHSNFAVSSCAKKALEVLKAK